MDPQYATAGRTLAEFSAELVELADPLPPITPMPGVGPAQFPKATYPATEFLASRCIRVNKSDVKIKLNGVWKHQPLGAAKATLLQHFGGGRTEFSFEEKDFKRFIEAEIRYIYGEGLFPGWPEFVTFENFEYLNIWNDTRMVPVPNWLPRCEMILRILRENLCNLPPASYKEMLTEIASSDDRLFRYVMHWLAAVYQRPGYHIGTVLWFCGERTGIGKGTLLKIMRRLLGSQYVGKLNADEMRAGFSGSFASKLLMEGDEFDIGSRKDLSDRFKVWVSNPLLNIHRKHAQPFDVPNVVNFLMTTNELQPIYLDREDRRHTLVQTTNRGLEASDMVRAYLPPLKAGADSPEQLELTRDLHGFAALLSLIDIDYSLISRPFMTELRAEIMRGAANAVDLWFMRTDPDWLIGTTLSATEAFQKFRDWAMLNHTTGYKTITNEISFGRQLNWLKSQAYVKSEHTRVGSKLTKLKYYSPETEAALYAKHQTEAVLNSMTEKERIGWFIDGCPTPSVFESTKVPDFASVNGSAAPSECMDADTLGVA